MKRRIMLLVVCLLFASSVIYAVPFKLLNNSLKSIPLEIPGVMNPNLSPMSSSGVDLAVGQKVYFKVKRKRYLLLEVTEDLRDQKLEVSALIKEAKRKYILE